MSAEVAGGERAILARLTALVAGLLDVSRDQVDPNAPFVEMGANSLILLEARRTVEEVFGVRLRLRDLFEDVDTLSKLAAHLAARTSGRSAPAPPPVLAPSVPRAPALPPPTRLPAQASSSGELVDLFRRQLQLLSDVSAAQLAVLRGTAVDRAPERTATAVARAGAACEVRAPAALPPLRAERRPPDLPLGADPAVQARRDAHLRALAERLSRRASGSKALAGRSRARLADRRASIGFRLPTKEMLFPIAVREGRGARFTDIDGNPYVDLTMGFGTLFFGHAPPFVTSAIEEQLARGIPVGPQSHLAGEVAEEICEIAGVDRATFCVTGSEAVMSALRLARLATGRSRIAIFEGAYHGLYDATLMDGSGPAGRGAAVPAIGGIPQAIADDVLVLPYGDPVSLEIIESRRDELAAVLVEPVQSRRPELQPRQFLHDLRRLTSDAGVVLIFDEILTGFRVHPRGVRGLFEIDADLVTYGKVLGGGLPIGVVAGRADLLAGADGGTWEYGDASFPRKESTWLGGTYIKHPLSMAVARAVTRRLREAGPALQEQVNRRCQELARRANECFERASAPIRLEHFGSIFRFSVSDPLDAFFFHLLEQGVYVWEGRSCCLSVAHGQAEIDHVVAAIETSLEQMQAGGFLGAPRGAAREPATAPVSRAREIALADGQRQLWLLAELDAQAVAAYNECGVIELRGRFDAEAAVRVCRRLVARHEALRTALAPDGSGQTIQPAPLFEPSFLDFAHLAEDTRRDAVRRTLEEINREPFDLSRAPLCRFAVIRVDRDEHLLAAVVHHAVADGWSLALLLREFVALYREDAAGAEAGLPEPIQLSDYVAWLERCAAAPDRERGRRFWREVLAGSSGVLELPVDRRRPPAWEYRGGRVRRPIDAGLHQRIAALAADLGATPFAVLLTGFALLLHRMSGEDDVLIGVPSQVRGLTGGDGLVANCANLLPIRSRLAPGASFADHVAAVRGVLLDAIEHAEVPFPEILHERNPRRDLDRPPLVQAVFNLDRAPPLPSLPGLDVQVRDTPVGWARFELFFNVLEDGHRLQLDVDYAAALFDRETVESWTGCYLRLLDAAAADPRAPAAAISLVETEPDEDVAVAAVAAPTATCVHERIAAQVERTPDATAVICGGRRLSYRELDARANRLANRLRRLGVGPDVPVGICLERGLALPVAVLAVLEAGGAYVPLDPSYPAERLAFILSDARIPLVLTEPDARDRVPPHSGQTLSIEIDAPEADAEVAPPSLAQPADLAYAIYTSGSTGRPKGVLIEHRNVANLFAALDLCFGAEDPQVWLAVTSFSFDISVLELLWTLSRGDSVVLLESAAAARRPAAPPPRPSRPKPVEFSLFYFASNEGEAGDDPYRLLFEGARFADRNSFSAVWTPERHFHAFGGLYPNPAVTAAALAQITRRVAIRAGSVVLPLHHPVRVAEEWSLVDVLSHGRVGVSFASGWQPADFVLAPGAYTSRREEMYRAIEIVRRLWRGESVELPGPDGRPVEVRTLPRPVQRELPIWVTTAGSADTAGRAGAIGANLLTNLLGQDVPEIEAKIASYRRAWRDAGHGPGDGHVTLMLHAFVGDDDASVREVVRPPMRDYLRSSLGLVGNLMRSSAPDGAFADLSEDDQDALLDHAFERYFETSGLLGSRDRCRAMVERLRAAGVDELACLVDFGVEPTLALEHLTHLREVFDEPTIDSPSPREDPRYAALIERHGVTNLQCTPSLARLLLADPGSRRALGGLRRILVGGEPVPTALVEELRRAAPRARIYTMYGPTETTVWSSIGEIGPSDTAIAPLGAPIANTSFQVLDRALRPVPAGVHGELCIGGAGVARGYLGRPDLVAERFVADPREAGARVYRTGDRVRRRADGTLEFLGRNDRQIKLRGHRIELAEIEAQLAEHAAVGECAVVASAVGEADLRLEAHVVPAPGAAFDAAALRGFLSRRLPEFMLPAVFEHAGPLPRLPNGKLDHGAVSERRASRPEAEARPLRADSPLLDLISGIWERLLGVSGAQPDDDFFELGGNSLLAFQLVAELRRTFQVKLPLRELFKAPTLFGVSRAIAAARRREAGSRELPVQRVPRDGELLLSSGQTQLWFMEQLQPGLPVWNIAGAVDLVGDLDVPCLRRALAEIVARHEVLRTTFEPGESRPLARIAAPGPFDLPLTDLRGLPEPERSAEAARLVRAEATRPFDLARGPLLRASLIALGDARHRLVVDMHHIVSDNASLQILIDELAAAYLALRSGELPRLPPLPIQYADHADWQQRCLAAGAYDEDLAWWRRRLAGAPPLELPTDRLRPTHTRQPGTVHAFEIPPDVIAPLRGVARAEGATLFMVLLAGFQALLERLGGESDITIAVPVTLRHRPETAGLIGYLVNLLMIRSGPEPSTSFRELLARARAATLEAWERREVPFERVVQEVAPQRRPGEIPLFRVMFDFEPAVPAVEVAGLTLLPERVENGTAKFDLTLFVIEGAGAHRGILEYRSDLFDADTIAGWAGLFVRLLAEIPAALDAPLSSLTRGAPVAATALVSLFNEELRGGLQLGRAG